MLKSLFQEDADSLFKRAREVAEKKETVYCSPMPVTTVCNIKPLCRHCTWKSLSPLDDEYNRINPKENIIERVLNGNKQGIHRVHMVSGWMGYELPDYFYDYLKLIKDTANFEVYGFFGPLSRKTLELLRSCGMEGYWCGIEMPNIKIFKEIRPGDNFVARLETLKNARDLGMKTWSSFITGLGETQDDIIYGLELMKSLGVSSVTIQMFQPRANTDLERITPPNIYEWSKIIAITRIYMTDVDLFVSPDTAPWGLRAGANGFSPFFSTIYSAEKNKNSLDGMRERFLSSGIVR